MEISNRIKQELKITIMIYKRIHLAIPLCIALALCGCMKAQAKEMYKPQGGINISPAKSGGGGDVSMITIGNLKEIYLAGGCFWGVEGYFRRIAGVVETDTGYANGTTGTTDYQQIHGTDHAETVKITYNSGVIALEELLEHYFRIIDPLSVNKQGNDIGRQYRTGIYYTDKADAPVIQAFLKRMQARYTRPIAVETAPLRNFVLAEEYHQDYLEKNPNGYCHINLNLASVPLHDEAQFQTPDAKQLKERLTPLQYSVTQEKATERPFTSEYDKFDGKGIYVDIVTGKPLFSSSDKYDAGCGWPSFTKPITSQAVDFTRDSSHGMERVEVTSKTGGAHLGHVFDDGPQDKTGLRYCINGASLRFVPYGEMDAAGYGDYKQYVTD